MDDYKKQLKLVLNKKKLGRDAFLVNYFNNVSTHCDKIDHDMDDDIVITLLRNSLFSEMLS